jgi:hypothetical protein
MRMAPPSRSLVLAAVVAAASLAGCGVDTKDLEAFEVTITPALDCTRNASSNSCVDEDVLAAQRTKGRWVIEHGPGLTFLATLEEGESITGVYFSDDGQLTENLNTILNGQPCQGAGGLCYFGRQRFTSTDPDNNNCTRFGELALVIHRDTDDGFVGRIGDTRGSDDLCGTATVVQRVEDVTGTRAINPAPGRTDPL